jgi:hypothetical protein
MTMPTVASLPGRKKRPGMTGPRNAGVKKPERVKNSIEVFDFTLGADTSEVESLLQRRLVRDFSRCFGGGDADEASPAAAVFKLDVAGDQREKRIVLAKADVFAGLVLGAALAN